MNGQSRPGHLTYYEQLGVPANASSEEIRDAYRALARMLHPDQQTDENLKRIAEQQMRKLNPIYTVLSDPLRRRQYDEDLAEEFSPTIAREGPRPVGESRVPGRIVWGVAILVAVGLLYWLAAGSSGISFNSDQVESRPTVPIFIPQTKPAEQTANNGAQLADLQAQLKTLTAERDFAVHELTRLKAAAALVSSAAPPVQPAASEHHSSASASALTELPSSSTAAVRSEPAVPTKPALRPIAKPTLTGFWFYAPPKKSEKGHAQPAHQPEFIEATIVEQNGVVKGKYRSRLQVTDRAANPEINFSFTGRPNGMTLTCPWIGQGGAKGEVTMRMTSDNSLRLDWAASEMGSQLGMASGTAILTRRID